MTEPKIFDRKPILINLEAGTHYWCACGLSSSQPMCDGSHGGTDIAPLPFDVEEPGEAALCLCKYTKNPPYCDGTHATLDAEPAQSPKPTSAPQVKNTQEEATLEFVHRLAKDGLSKSGHHGEMGAMGVPLPSLPQWDDIQILTAQLATRPLMDDVEVGTGVVIGPNAKKPLHLDIPLFVSDMSFGALSMEAKTALARGAERAGTGICSGEGECFLKSIKKTPAIFTNWLPLNLDIRKTCLPACRRFTSRQDKQPRPELAGTFPGAK